MKVTTRASIFIGLLLLFYRVVMAGGVSFWEISRQTEIERGDINGVSVSDRKGIQLSPALLEVFNTEQPFIFSSLADTTGNIYLGTGHEGRVYKVDKAGKSALWLDTEELDITALAIDSTGNLYVGSSPDGKVYRVNTNGQSSLFFDPIDKYIWSLAIDKANNLYVGTGDNGIIYKVDSNGKGTVHTKTNEKHIICLVFDAQGALLAGTDPSGLVLRIGSDGKPFALLDTNMKEIHRLALAGNGDIYALALSAQAGAEKSTTTSSTPPPASENSGSVTIVASFDDDSPPTSNTPQASSSTSRSDGSVKAVVYRITSDGGNDVIWSTRDTVAFSLVVNKNGELLIGTGTKGRVYAIDVTNRTTTLLTQSKEEQVTILVSTTNGIYLATSNAGKLLRLSNDVVKEGFYTSPVHDTKFTATWGRISWRSTGAVEIQTRSGNTELPDDTWSNWSTAYQIGEGEQVTSPAARFIQWRARLQLAATLMAVKLAYLPRNNPPEVTQITILPPGIGLQEIPQQPIDPGIISAGLDPATFGLPTNIQPRKVFQKGARSLQWQAEDRNGDTLSYNLFYRALADTQWHQLIIDLKNNYFTLDADALPDGKYLFRVVASDIPVNPAERAGKGELISDVVEIDNTPPQVIVPSPRTTNRKVECTFTVKDNLSVIRRAEYSVNGGNWQTVFPDDGIADATIESYTVKLELPNSGEHIIAFRCYDDDANVGGAKVTVKLGN